MKISERLREATQRLRDSDQCLLELINEYREDTESSLEELKAVSYTHLTLPTILRV